MDLGKSFSFVFEDEQWVKKLLIGGIVSIVPVLNLAAIGYALRTLRNVAADQPRPLPEWDDLGGDWVRGLATAVAGFIYALPLLIVLVPVIILTALLGGQNGNGDAFVGTVLLAGPSCLALPYGLLVSAWMPAAMARYAVDGEFVAFFRFREIWRLIARNPGSYVIAVLVYLIVGQIASMVGALVLFIGAAFTGFWASLLGAHLFGQLARGDTNRPPVAAV